LVSPENKFKKYELANAFQTKCQDLYDKNYKELGLYLIRFNGERGIARCKHLEKENVINLINSIEKINSKNIKIKTIATSGTIKALIRKHF
jgi:RNase P/RNase MRP subunit POP5